MAQLPVLGRLFPYTPKKWAPEASRWLAERPIEGFLVEIHRQATLPLLPPKVVEDAPAWAFARTNHPVPGASIAVLPHARYVHWRGFGLITHGNALLGDFSRDEGALAPPHSLMSYPGRRPPQVVPGQLAVLHTPFVRHNYAHWLLDCLPRLLLLKHHYADFALIENFVFDQGGHGFQAESLAMSGLQTEQIITPGPGMHLTADVLVNPSFIHAVFHSQPWAIELLRQEFLPAVSDTSGSPRRIFVSRQNARGGRIANYAQVEALLARQDFAVVDPTAMPWREQVRLFAGAEFIVAPHGAGLANLVFVPEGAKVVEIFSPAYFPTYFWELCSHRRLPYWTLFGEGPVGRQGISQDGNRDTDITLDIEKMARLLDELE